MEAQWVALQVCSGRELNVKWAIDELFPQSRGLENLICETLAPVRQIAVHSTKNIIIEPVIKGYVFVRCIMTDHLWHFLRNIPYVFKILNGPVSDEEIRRLLPQFGKLAELNLPEKAMLDRIKKRFKDLIETRRNKKDVIRIPLNIFRGLLKSARLFFAGPITEKKVFRMLLDFP